MRRNLVQHSAFSILNIHYQHDLQITEKNRENDGESGPWYSISFRTQRAIIDQADPQTLAALGEELGESDTPLTVAQGLLATEVNPEDIKIGYGKDGVVTIPAAAYSKPSGRADDVITTKSFSGGMQVFLPRFGVVGLTILRGGGWRTDANGCKHHAVVLRRRSAAAGGGGQNIHAEAGEVTAL